MKIIGVIVTVLAAMASLQVSLAQNVTDCTAISASLGTTPIDPVTSEFYYCQPHRIHHQLGNQFEMLFSTVTA